jgi:hypothetical protein
MSGIENKTSLMCGLSGVVALVSLVLGGCGSQSSAQALSRALAAAGAKQETCARFAGTVKIDGLPPGDMGVTRTLVVLWNTKAPPKGMPPFAPCDPDGYFEFHTYDKADGIAAGNYVVCFVQLQGGMRLGDAARGWRGPDKLNNLYSDPDKNKEDKDLVVDITPPGKTSWEFNLHVDGKEPVENPGPHAIKELR